MAEEARRYVSVHTGERIDNSVGRAPQVVDIQHANIGDFAPGTILIDSSTYALYITVAENPQKSVSTAVRLLVAGVANIDGSIGNVIAYSPTDTSVTPQKAIKYMQVGQVGSQSEGGAAEDTVTFQVPTVSLTKEGSGTEDYVLNIDFFPSNN